MTYKKAEIRVLGEAAAVIQDLSKTDVFGVDQRDASNIFATNPAYDLDE